MGLPSKARGKWRGGGKGKGSRKGRIFVQLQFFLRKNPATKKPVATVMIGTGRIAAAAKIDQSYLPGGANIQHIQYMVSWVHPSLPLDGIAIGSVVLQIPPVCLIHEKDRIKNTKRATSVAIGSIHGGDWIIDLTNPWK